MFPNLEHYFQKFCNTWRIKLNVTNLEISFATFHNTFVNGYVILLQNSTNKVLLLFGQLVENARLPLLLYRRGSTGFAYYVRTYILL